MTNKNKKEGFIMRALDTVERVGNGMPDPVTLFIILVGVVILASAICAGLGVSVTYQSIDTASGHLQDVTVSAVNLLSADGIRHMVTTVVSNFTSFFPLGTVFTIMIGVGVADGSGFMSALLRKVVANTEGVQSFPVPEILCRGLEASSIRFAVFFWAAEPRWWQTQARLRCRVLEIFRENGIEIPFNQLDVTVKHS